MEKLVLALGPAFAAGLAVQRLLEILDPFLEKLLGDNKKAILGVIALLVGIALAAGTGMRVLEPLGISVVGAADILVTGLIISAGTEGFNSLLKFLGYAKENKKAEAATKQAEATPAAQTLIQKL
jgi:hypothetical protein